MGLWGRVVAQLLDNAGIADLFRRINRFHEWRLGDVNVRLMPELNNKKPKTQLSASSAAQSESQF
jgi:hypothetical protein